MKISHQVASKSNFSMKEYADIDTIAELATKAAKLVIKGMPFTEVAVVSDRDGTLTTHGISDDDYNDDTQVKARGETVEVIQWMENNKINVIFSSAWDKFDHTLNRLQKLGLGDFLKGTKSSKDFTQHGRLYRVNALGRAVSVSSPPPTPARPYYRGKAYSAYFFNPNLAKKLK
ncbi:MAG: hypothetical protein K0M45_10490 [Candidatus Paracaedibacteraceae bacterium]|nr:hypothetical protein [Candidatus Paracaedibacteraceae bacterium]